MWHKPKPHRTVTRDPRDALGYEIVKGSCHIENICSAFEFGHGVPPHLAGSARVLSVSLPYSIHRVVLERRVMHCAVHHAGQRSRVPAPHAALIPLRGLRLRRLPGWAGDGHPLAQPYHLYLKYQSANFHVRSFV